VFDNQMFARVYFYTGETMGETFRVVPSSF